VSASLILRALLSRAGICVRSAIAGLGLLEALVRASVSPPPPIFRLAREGLEGGDGSDGSVAVKFDAADGLLKGFFRLGEDLAMNAGRIGIILDLKTGNAGSSPADRELVLLLDDVPYFEMEGVKSTSGGGEEELDLQGGDLDLDGEDE